MCCEPRRGNFVFLMKIRAAEKDHINKPGTMKTYQQSEKSKKTVASMKINKADKDAKDEDKKAKAGKNSKEVLKNGQ